MRAALRFRLIERRVASPDSWLLRFALPPALRTLTDDPALQTGLKAIHEGAEKSYSPVSHPAERGSVDLLVKRYAPQPGGGISDSLCSLAVGDEAELRIKPPRQIHGSAAVARRWRQLGLVACGTGIAPFVQILRMLHLDAAAEDRTEVSLLSINRTVDDTLMRREIDELAASWPGQRLKVRGGHI